jgi:hypothetical protein
MGRVSNAFVHDDSEDLDDGEDGFDLDTNLLGCEAATGVPEWNVSGPDITPKISIVRASVENIFAGQSKVIEGSGLVVHEGRNRK